MGVRRGIDRKKVGCRSLIDANLEGQVGVNKFKLYFCVLCMNSIPPEHCVPRGKWWGVTLYNYNHKYKIQNANKFLNQGKHDDKSIKLCHMYLFILNNYCKI